MTHADFQFCCIDSLRPCAFWGYDSISSYVLGAINAYFNEMCYCNEALLRMLRLNEYILASISYLAEVRRSGQYSLVSYEKDNVCPKGQY